MPAVLLAFGPIEAIADYVGPDWGAVSQPDLFEQPTRTDEVARYIEHRIYAAGRLYWRMARSPSVADTRELLKDLEGRLAAVARSMRRLEHARNAFNAARGLDADDEEFPSNDRWESLSVAIEDGWDRVTFLQRRDVDVGELLEQPPTNRKAPERVLWEALFALLQECGIEPLEKYQALIYTLRAAHLLFEIDPPPNAGSVGYVKSEFLKPQPGSGNQQGIG